MPTQDNITVTADTPTGAGADTNALEVNASNDPNNGRPTFLLDKFKTVEDQAKAYIELQKLLGRRQANEPEENLGDTDTTPVTPEVTPEAKAPKSSLEIPEGAPETTTPAPTLDLDALAAEMAQGGLSDQSKALLASKGIPESVVTAYHQSKQSAAQATLATIQGAAGGPEGYQQLVQWAKANLTPGEIQAFNKTVTSGDVDAAALVVQGLAARAKGSDPKLILGGNPGSQAVKPFTTEREMLEAFQDPRYRRGDPEFTAKVSARMAATQSWR